MSLKYIAISGNSGAGKSTLLKKLAPELRISGLTIDVADEREFHHPLLLNMFHEPRVWAYPMQLNFALQRFVRLIQAAETSCPPAALLMERCLWEDELFFRYYLRSGAIPANFEEGYYKVWQAMTSTAIRPNAIVHLRSTIDGSCSRLAAAFQAGERPAEIFGPALRNYITAMNELYDEWAKVAPELCDVYLEFHVDSPSFSPEEIVRQIDLQVLSKEGNH